MFTNLGVSSIIEIAMLIIVSVQLYFLRKAYKADHERRKKQSTIEYLSRIRDIYRPVDRKLIEKYGKKALNPEDVDKADMADLREFLSVLEHLSVGVNTGVYDIELVNRMSGTFLLETHAKVTPYINFSRKDRGSDSIYQEFDVMSRKIKGMREKLFLKGNIIYS